MYKLTPDQYDAFFLAAVNLCMADDRDQALTYAVWLTSYTAILTGEYPKKGTTDKALEIAKGRHGFNRENADVIIKHFIGEFSYDPSQFHRITKISKAEMDELKAMMDQ